MESLENPAPEKLPNAHPRLLYPQGRGLGEDAGCSWPRQGRQEGRNLDRWVLVGISAVAAGLVLAFLAVAVIQSF
jgi:hypothetical protein